MAKTFLQVRTEEADKEQASVILEALGTNLSTVVNMLLKQIVITRGIPFEVKIPHTYSAAERVSEVKATMAMEGMSLTMEDIQLLKEYQASSDKESIRKQLLAEYMED